MLKTTDAEVKGTITNRFTKLKDGVNNCFNEFKENNKENKKAHLNENNVN